MNPRCPQRDDTGNIEPVDTVFCDRCRKRVGQDLVELAELYVELHSALQPTNESSSSDPGKQHKRPAAPLPMNAEYVSLMDDIVREIGTIADRIRAERYGRILKPSETPGRRQRRGHLLSRSIDFLTANLHWALEKHDDGADTGMRILRLNHDVRSKLGHTRYVKRFDVPCPDCGGIAITQAAGEDDVQCQMCGSTWRASLIAALQHSVAYELGQVEGA